MRWRRWLKILSSFRKSFFQRRGPFVFFFILNVSLLTVEPARSAEASQQILEQAQNFILKKDREAATSILRRALESPATAPKVRTKLIESLQKFSTVFFTDKGQRTFESAQSLSFENPDLALAQLVEAQSLEGLNILILENQAKLMMARQDCAGALQKVTLARGQNPHAADVALIELRALLCLDKNLEFREKVKLLPTLNKWQNSFAQYLLAQDYFILKMPKRALEVLLKVAEENPKFPESYLALIRVGKELGRDVGPWQSKYVSLCRATGTKERKLYGLEPTLCGGLKEVESELAQTKNQS